MMGDLAFNHCTSLAIIVIPENVTSLRKSAFGFCGALRTIDIPARVSSIGPSAFEQSGLTSVTIPDGIAIIAFGVFQGCGGLKTVTIPKSVTKIGENAFTDTGTHPNDAPSFLGVYYGGSQTDWKKIDIDKSGGSNIPLQNATIRFNHSPKITVTFDTKGSTVSKPADPTRTGFTFGGWFRESACTTP